MLLCGYEHCWHNQKKKKRKKEENWWQRKEQTLSIVAGDLAIILDADSICYDKIVRLICNRFSCWSFVSLVLFFSIYILLLRYVLQISCMWEFDKMNLLKRNHTTHHTDQPMTMMVECMLPQCTEIHWYITLYYDESVILNNKDLIRPQLLLIFFCHCNKNRTHISSPALSEKLD